MINNLTGFTLTVGVIYSIIFNFFLIFLIFFLAFA